MVSVQFCKNVTGPPFSGGWKKKLQTFSRGFFWGRPSKYCIVEFTAVFACLLLSWFQRYSMNSTARNFNNRVRLQSKWLWVQVQLQSLNSWPLYLNFSNMINLCPSIWFIKNSKRQQFVFLEKELPKTTHFLNVFRGPLVRNGWPYWYKCWRVLRDLCGLSKKYCFTTFPKI